MAAMAPSRTNSGVGRSQMPWPRLIPPTRSHSRVMWRISDCARELRRFAIRMGPDLRLEGILQGRARRQIAQRLDHHVHPALQIGNRQLLVHVVARIGLARKPHSKRDGVGYPL